MQEQPQQLVDEPIVEGESNQGQPCRFFASGNCRYGQGCRYSHSDVGALPSSPVHLEPSPPPSSIACRYYAQGSCKFGNKCRFHHSQQAMNRQQNRLNSQPPAPGSPCRFFAQGRCRFGQDCRYSHDGSLAHAYPPTGVPQGYPAYGRLMDPSMVAQVKEELALEAELANIDARMRAEYTDGSLEGEAEKIHEDAEKVAQAQHGGEANPSAAVQPEKSG